MGSRPYCEYKPDFPPPMMGYSRPAMTPEQRIFKAFANWLKKLVKR
ncbi:MAG: hypothetical protein HYT22_03255 [Candidatus Niyogibacteria bacterium]|nr:hypothetical protein [Candidatus Niyogibacteria bacterium]